MLCIECNMHEQKSVSERQIGQLICHKLSENAYKSAHKSKQELILITSQQFRFKMICAQPTRNSEFAKHDAKSS